MSKEKEETEIVKINGAVGAEASKEKRIGCAHYKRRAKFVVSCNSHIIIFIDII